MLPSVKHDKIFVCELAQIIPCSPSFWISSSPWSLCCAPISTPCTFAQVGEVHCTLHRQSPRLIYLASYPIYHVLFRSDPLLLSSLFERPDIKSLHNTDQVTKAQNLSMFTIFQGLSKWQYICYHDKRLHL